MQVELSVNDLDLVMEWFTIAYESGEVGNDDFILAKRIRTGLQEAKELEEMDFDDCAGGACKL